MLGIHNNCEIIMVYKTCPHPNISKSQKTLSIWKFTLMCICRPYYFNSNTIFQLGFVCFVYYYQQWKETLCLFWLFYENQAIMNIILKYKCQLFLVKYKCKLYLNGNMTFWHGIINDKFSWMCLSIQLVDKNFSKRFYNFQH